MGGVLPLPPPVLVPGGGGGGVGCVLPLPPPVLVPGGGGWGVCSLSHPQCLCRGEGGGGCAPSPTPSACVRMWVTADWTSIQNTYAIKLFDTNVDCKVHYWYTVWCITGRGVARGVSELSGNPLRKFRLRKNFTKTELRG